MDYGNNCGKRVQPIALVGGLKNKYTGGVVWDRRKVCGAYIEWLTIISYCLSLLDLVFTLYLCVRYGGVGKVEFNQFGRLLLASPITSVIYKVVVVGYALRLLYGLRKYRTAQYAIYGVFGVFVLITIYHIILIGYAHYLVYILPSV